MPAWSISGCVAEPPLIVRLAAALDALNAAYSARRQGNSSKRLALCAAWLEKDTRRHVVLREGIRRVREV